MSKSLVKGVLAAALAVGMSASYGQQTASAALSVTATIQGGCVLSLSGPMAFGDLDVTSTANETKSVTVSFACATGESVTNFTVGGENDGSYSDSMAHNTLPAAPANAIPYTIAWTQPALPFAGAGFGAPVNVVLNGTILNANYISKPSGSYSDSVIVAVNY